MTSTTATRYTSTAILLHWLMALLLLITFSVGVYMSDLTLSPTKLKLVNWHKWAGITILVLAALRLLWRLGHKPPPDVPMPALQARAAHVMQLLMYLLFFAIPLAGWAMSSAKGVSVVWFGVLPLPDWVPKDKPLGHQLEQVHAALAWLLAVLVVGHTGAALKHAFIDKDHLLARMGIGRS